MLDRRSQEESVMALDASELLGSPQLAGAKVNPRGTGKRRMAGGAGLGGGLVGAALGAAASMRAEKQQATTAAASETPDFSGIAYVAVTANDLALIKLVSKVVTVQLGEIIARVPRATVASAEVGGGVSPSLTIAFHDGGSWLLEVPRPFKKSAEGIVRALAG
jgi:hypothetical protein